MDKLKYGETAVLEDGKEYVCFACLEDQDEDYVYLVSNFKPVEVRFARQQLINGELQLEIIFDKERKFYLYNLFKTKMGKSN